MATQSISTKMIVHNLSGFAQRLRQEVGPLSGLQVSADVVIYDVMKAIGLESPDIRQVLGDEVDAIDDRAIDDRGIEEQG